MKETQLNRLVSTAALFTSASTLVCCALPAFFVALGMGATFAGLIGAFPGLVWFSEHAGIIFPLAGVCLLLNGGLQYRNRNAPCPIDPELAAACTRTRRWSAWVFGVSVAAYLVGIFFAFIAPRL